MVCGQVEQSFYEWVVPRECRGAEVEEVLGDNHRYHDAEEDRALACVPARSCLQDHRELPGREGQPHSTISGLSPADRYIGVLSASCLECDASSR